MTTTETLGGQLDGRPRCGRHRRGSATLPEFRSTARPTPVADQSFQERRADVTPPDTPTPVS
ncbi:hypothetical protein [Streptomyces sp. NPDC058295]|uniref:hypothetical protein n=1 Tax=Streptomyces sp. NPDC058295 TaxID=3346431 RepID=UPI0036EEB784